MVVTVSLLEDPAIKKAIAEHPETLEKRLQKLQSNDFLTKISGEFDSITREYCLPVEQFARDTAYRELMKLRFPIIDPAFLSIPQVYRNHLTGEGKVWQQDTLPRFGVYSPDGNRCSLNLPYAHDTEGVYRYHNGGNEYTIPSVLSSQMMRAVHGVRDENKWISSTYTGTVPTQIKTVISTVKPYFDQVFIVAEAQWKEEKRPVKDPLVIGIKMDSCFLLGAYNCSLPEEFVKEHFVRDE